MTFFDHVNVLRKHLWASVSVIILGFALSFIFYDYLIEILLIPLESSLSGADSRLYITAVYEGILTKFRISFSAGIFLTLPFHIINFLLFLIPALTRREKKIAAASILSVFILTVAALVYGYRYLIPLSIAFMTGSSIVTEGTFFLLRFSDNIFYLIQFITALVVVFQLPLLVILLTGLNIMSVKSAFRSGKYMILAAFILSAILTPPDYVSQVMTALPLILLYYLSLLTAWIIYPGRRG